MTRLLWIHDHHALEPSPNGQGHRGASFAFVRQRLEAAAERFGWVIISIAGARAASEFAARESFDIAFISAPLEDWLAEEAVEELLRRHPVAPVIVLDDAADIDAALRLARCGAFAVLRSSDPEEKWTARFEQAVELTRSLALRSLAGAVGEEPWRRFLVGESRSMCQVSEIIRLVARRRCTVLISGETGTGKEMAARAIHEASDRAAMPLVAVNCSALPEALLESELFGHVKGAFTGAATTRIGRFEQAHRGTLLLDEIGDLPLDLQAKLLRVLQEREFQRLGSSETIKVDVRVIAATNVDLQERIRKGRFREDLYYRLNVVPIHMPPLRERRSDIPLLVQHFIEKICRQERIPMRRISPEALRRLTQYEWPGNVRQLENAVEMATVLSGDREILLPSDFPLPAPSEGKPSPKGILPRIHLPEEGLDFERLVASIERDILRQALERTRGNKKQAAEMLGLKRTTLAAKLKSLEGVSS